jgi:hypothetical protein
VACGKRGCFGQDVDVGGVRVEELLLITLSASDPDGDDLTFDATLPPGGVLTDNVLTWSPSAEQVGSFIVTITVTDGSGGSSSAIGAKSGQSISCGYIRCVVVAHPRRRRALRTGIVPGDRTGGLRERHSDATLRAVAIGGAAQHESYEYLKTPVRYFAFDSFEGFPKPQGVDVTDKAPQHWQEGDVAMTQRDFLEAVATLGWM